MGNIPSKLHEETYQLLKKIQEKLPGNPPMINLLDEAVKLLAQKYLKEEPDAHP